jgi:hypothetical protein
MGTYLSPIKAIKMRARNDMLKKNERHTYRVKRQKKRPVKSDEMINIRE